MRGFLAIPLLGVVLAAQAAPELVVSVGHAGAPQHAAFAGRYLVTSTSSNLAFIELSTGITVSHLPQGSLVETIEPSPAGDIVAVGACSHGINLYDVNTLALVRRLPIAQECASSISFSSDGALLAADNYGCCRGGSGLRIWNVRTGNVVRELSGVTSIRHVAFGGNRWLAAIDDNGKATVFEWPSARILRTFSVEGSGYGGSVAIGSRDGRYLLWHRKGDGPRVWNVTSGEEVPLPNQERLFTATATFLDDGRLAYVDSDQLIVMQLPGGPVQTVPLATTAMQSYDVILNDAEGWLAIRRDGLMAAGKRETTTLLWDVGGARLRDVKAPALVSPASLQWTRTGLIGFADAQSGARAWDDRQGALVDIGTPVTWAESLAFSPDGARAAVAGLDSMYVLNVARRRPVSARTLPPAGDPGVAYSPNGSRLAFQSPSGFWLFDHTLRPLRRIATLDQYGGVERVAFSGDNRWIAASLGGSSPTLQVWPAAGSGNSTTLDLEKVTYTHRGRALAFSHDSRWLASFRKGSALTVWSTAGWTIERTWSIPGTGMALGFAPTDSRLAIASDDEAAIWDAADGRKLVGLSTLGSANLQEVAWSPDGRRVVTSADDGVLRFWNASDGRLIASLYVFDSRRDWLLVTPDGRVDGSDNAVTGFIAWRVGDRVSLDPALTPRRRVRGLWQSLASSMR